MHKTLVMTCALVPWLFACSDGETKITPDAAVPVDSAIQLDGSPTKLDTASPEVAKPSDTLIGVDQAGNGDGPVGDVTAADAPMVDAPMVDAPVADAGADAGDAGADDASGCQPSLPIVRVNTGITTDTTWTTGKVYVVEQSIVLNALLTVEPGAVVKFMKGPMITLGTQGALFAVSDSSATPIVFTSIKDDAHGGDTNGDCHATAPAPGDWASIKLSGKSSRFRFAEFYYAGSAKPYSGAVSVINNGSADFKGCVFAHNDGGKLDDTRAAALNLGSAAGGAVVADNHFYDNVVPAVINGLQNFDDSNTFVHTDPGTGMVQRNTYNGIFMDGAVHSVSGAVTWSNIQVPYVLYEVTLSIVDGGTLVLADNVVVKNYKSRIDVANLGTLTIGAGVAFTSFHDDSRLGDSNGDGTTSAPTKGDWTGISVCKPLCSPSTAGNIFYASNN